MINYFKIIKGHNKAAKEHIETYKLEHKTTILQAIILTLKDILRYRHIQIGDAYLVYQPIYINTLGIRVARVLRVYVPKELRGQGIASEMRDMIPEKAVLEEMSNGKEANYRTVGVTCVVRSHL